MKLNPVLARNQWAVVTILVVSQLIISCTASKKNNRDIPKSYGITGAKGISNAEARSNYVDRYKAIAIREMERTGIPASIKLAQGVLESDAGRSTLSSQYNNHFGIKCHSDWQGERYYKEDDDKDPVTGQLIKSCFRAYKNGDESFIAHSEFLRDPRKVYRYGSLFQLDPKDYVGWANGLVKAGYATGQTYGETLIRLVEDLQLHQYDLMSSNDVASNNNGQNNNSSGNPNFPNNNNSSGNPNFPNNDNSGFDNPSGNNANNSVSVSSGQRNDVGYLKINGGLTLEQVAGRQDISIRKLQEYNEEIGDPTRRLPEGTIIYTQQKRNHWSGSDKTYRVQACETMFDISQKFGIKLSKLYSKNSMREGDQPAIGEKISLRKGLFERVDMPALRDTFGEWKKCRQPDLIIEKPVTNPSNVNRPTNPPVTNSGEFGFEITPGGNTQPSSSYPSTQPIYPPSSYPSSPSNYPTTETSTSPSYPTTQPTYPSTKPSYPSTETGTSYPSTQPAKPSTVPKPTTPKPTQPAINSQYYTVLQGETLWAISRKFSLTVDQLKQMNGLADNVIKPGQQLRIK